MAAAALLLVLATAFFSIGLHTQASAPPAAAREAEIYTGTILLAASPSKRCRQMTFDNQSGLIQQARTVGCGITAESGATDRPPATTIDRVREGFRNR